MNLKQLADEITAMLGRKLAIVGKNINDIAAALVEMDTRLKAVEAREPARVDESAVLARVEAHVRQIAAAVAKHLQANPPPKAADVTGVVLEAVAADLASGGRLAEALKAHLGEPIVPAIPTAGEVAKEVLRSEGLASAVQLRVKEEVASLPAPKDPDPIPDERIAGQVAEYLKGNPPAAGADGVGLAGAMIDKGGELIVTTTKGETIRLGRVVGRDGLSVEGLVRQYDATTHEIVETWKSGEVEKTLRYPAGGIRPAGYWKERTLAKSGEAWTHEGTLWIALRDTSDRPNLDSKDWVIGARKGRDGISKAVKVQSA